MRNIYFDKSWIVLLLVLAMSICTLAAESGGAFVGFGLNAGYNEPANFNAGIKAEAGYSFPVLGVRLGLDTQMVLGSYLSSKVSGFYSNFMAGPMFVIPDDILELSVAKLWGASPTLLAKDKVNGEKSRVFRSEAWDFRFRVIPDKVGLDYHIVAYKPIPHQKTVLGFGVGLSFHN